MATREKVSKEVNGVKETRMVPRVPNSANAKPEEREFTKADLKHIMKLLQQQKGIGGPM